MILWFSKYLIKKQYYWLIIFIILLAIFSYLLWTKGDNLFVNYADIVFHQAVARGFIRADGPVTWNFWEALPEGRANNYPPIYHIILASLFSTGISIAIAIKVITLVTVVGGLIVFWLGLVKLFDWKIVTFSILTVLLSFKFILFSTMVQPATLVLWFTPWVLIFLREKRWINLTALLIILLYLHMIMPYFIIFGAIFYALFYQRKDLVKLLKSVSIALVVYLPWLGQIFLHRSSIKYLNSSIDDLGPSVKIWSFDLLFWALFIAGMIILIKSKKIVKSEFYYFIFIAILILPVSYFYPVRALNGHSFLLLAPIVGLAINYLSKYYFGIFALIILSGMLAGNFYFRVSNVGGWDFKNDKSSVREMVQYRTINQDSRSGERQVVELISNNSQVGESVAIIMNRFKGFSVGIDDQIHVANYFASLANRPVLNMRQPELSKREIPDFSRTKILITSVPLLEINTLYLLYPDLAKNPAISNALLENFQFISSVDLDSSNKVFLYKNIQKDVYKEITAKPSIPLKLAHILIVLLVALIIIPKNKNHK